MEEKLMATPTLQFDTLYPTHINGHIHTPVVKDQDLTPNRVLELDRDWTIELSWHLRSDDPDTDPVTGIGGNWLIRLGLESIGPGPEIDLLPTPTVKPISDYDSSNKASCTWKESFTIKAGKVTEEAVYQLVALIAYQFPDGSRGSMAGFVAGPLLTFYKD